MNTRPLVSDQEKDIQRGGTLKSEFENAAEKPTATFKECWAPASGMYENPRIVSGGFATIFPGSSTVESEFSIRNQDKSPQPSRLAELTVEGGFHARQWNQMEELLSLADSMYFVFECLCYYICFSNDVISLREYLSCGKHNPLY